LAKNALFVFHNKRTAKRSFLKKFSRFQVEKGSWAASQGLQMGDEIVSVNGLIIGVDISDAEDFLKEMKKRPIK
jgi:hypothetical protein